VNKEDTRSGKYNVTVSISSVIDYTFSIEIESHAIQLAIFN